MTYESLMIANQTITKIEVKGKEYAEVNQRIRVFRMLYPNGSIETNIESLEKGICVMSAVVKDDFGSVLGVGHAYEKEDSSFINKTSYIENCETSLGVECTLESALLMAQIKAALDGDTQAAKFVAQYSGQSNRAEEDLENKKAETELIKARKESITGENENNDALDRLDQILKEVRDNAIKQETE